MISPEHRAEIDKAMADLDDEGAEIMRRHNEQRERQTLLVSMDDNAKAMLEKSESGSCSDAWLAGNRVNEAHAAQVARLIRKVDDMEFSIIRAINWLDQGYRGEAKRELMRWIGERREQ